MEELLAVLANNRTDVEEIISQIGVGNLLKVSPALIRIVKTIAASKDPVVAADDASKTLLYSAATREQVRQFQQKHGLNADGLVGNQTWGMVETLLKQHGG